MTRDFLAYLAATAAIALAVSLAVVKLAAPAPAGVTIQLPPGLEGKVDVEGYLSIQDPHSGQWEQVDWRFGYKAR